MITVWHRQYEPDRRARIALLNALDRISYQQSQETPPPST